MEHTVWSASPPNFKSVTITVREKYIFKPIVTKRKTHFWEKRLFLQHQQSITSKEDFEKTICPIHKRIHHQEAHGLKCISSKFQVYNYNNSWELIISNQFLPNEKCTLEKNDFSLTTSIKTFYFTTDNFICSWFGGFTLLIPSVQRHM